MKRRFKHFRYILPSALAIFAAVQLCGCLDNARDNARAKHWGGTTTRNLPTNTKLVTVTWKGSNLWMLTRPMRADESAETYHFQDEPSSGVVQCTVIITESK